MRPATAIAVLLPALGLGLAGPVRLDAAATEEVKGMIQKGVAFLRGTLPHKDVGETALGALALAKAGAPASDPLIRKCVEKVLVDYAATQEGGGSVNRSQYVAAVVAMMLANVDPKAYRDQIIEIGRTLLGRQNLNGSWDYFPSRSRGDTSVTQMVLLALWELTGTGMEVVPSVWERAAGWLLKIQTAEGGFAYKPDMTDEPRIRLSVTAGTMGSLLLCRMELGLDPVRRPRGGRPHAMVKVVKREESETLGTTINAAIEKTAKLLGARLMPLADPEEQPKHALDDRGPPYYALYALERAGTLSAKRTFGSMDWWNAGLGFLRQKQKPNGSWKSGYYDAIVDTSFAVLFLVRSTAKSLRRETIQARLRVGRSLLAGGRGAPKAEGGDTVGPAGWYRPYTSPLKGTVDDLLTLLSKKSPEEDPETVLGSLMTLVDREGFESVADHTEALVHLTKHPRPATRRAALWLVARSEQVHFVPILIRGLADPAPEVYRQARDGLRFVSRRLDGFAMPARPSAAQREAGVKQWRAWYDQVRADVPLGAPLTR